MNAKNTESAALASVGVTRLVRELKPHEARYFASYEEGEEEYDTLNLRQNLEAPNGNHWQVKLNLKRWRTKEELSAYLHFAADVISDLPNA